jgi:signal transduction histidine kinase/CheY-like chemotaxis protein
VTGIVPNHPLAASSYTSITGRLSSQMLQIVAAMMFFVYLVFALSFFTHSYNQLKQKTNDDLFDDLEVMEFMLDEMMLRNGALSQRDTVIKGLIDPAGRNDYLPLFLKEQQELFGFDGLTLVNKRGQPLVDLRKGSNIAACLNVNEIQPPRFFYRPVENMVCLSVPIVMYGSVQGGLLGTFEVSRLMRFIKTRGIGLSQLFIGDRLAVQMITQKGRLKSGKRNSGLGGKKKMTNQYEIFERKGPAHFRHVRSLDITLIKGINHNVLYLPIINGLVDLLLLTIVIMVVTFLLTRHLVKKVTKPILQLCDKVSSSDESVLCSPTGTHDELETLAAVFDRKTQELIEAKLQAQKSDRAKSVFLANMSHEIRTPMNAIIGLAEILNKSALDNNQAHYTKSIRSAADRLLMLINDVLDLSKMESGKLSLETTRFSFHEWVEDLRIIFSNHGKKDVELVLVFEPKIPEYVIGDSLRLSQVCINLLSNAIKFTDKGVIEFKLEAQRTLDQKIVFECSVTDTGLGMSLEKTQEIFKPFIQAETNTTRKYGGTGLGLSISKQLVELMGGNLTCHSKINQGSRFDFKVALEAVDTCESQTCFEGCVGQKVLFITDQESSYQQAIMSTFTALSMPVQKMLGGDNALEDVQQAHDFDLIVYDCNPQEHRTEGHCNCVDCCSKIIVNNTKPMLVVLDRQDKEKITAGKEGDLYCVIEKPLSTFSLAQGINNFFKEENLSEAVLLDDDSQTKVTEDLSGLNILLVEDNDINQEIAIYLLEEYGAKVTLAENGLEAIEAIKKQQFDCVLMDLQMPVMGGIEATQVIRQDPQYHKIPIIALTADAMPEQLKGIKSSGMNARVLKPIDSALLLKTITSLVDDESAMAMMGEGLRKDFIS